MRATRCRVAASEEGRLLSRFAAGYFLRLPLQSGHGQCSQPQPVHASRIMILLAV
jgi:hypothetical protein